MVLRVFTTDSVDAGVRADLAAGDVLFVGEGVTLARTNSVLDNDATIRGLTSMNSLEIRGSVLALGPSILLGDDAAADGNNKVQIASTGLVKSFNSSAIRVNASTSSITNAGHIEGWSGIEINGQSNFYSSQITNSGTIAGLSYGIARGVSATERLVVENTGTITAEAYAFNGNLSANAIDIIRNKGSISGSIELGGGSDEYDGRLGTLNGYVSGSGGNDKILGGAGDDSFYGGMDSDHLDGGAGNDKLEGGSASDTLYGGSGDDIMDGGTGADEMHGGTGNDTFIVDDAADVVVELANGGTDTVKAWVSHTLSANVERLTLTGIGDIDGAGNALANILTGNSGKNTLKGGAGNDTLDGGAGVDRLEGGTGNDTYVVDDAGDVIVELAGEGTDTVKASVTYTLSADVERLTLTGSGDLDGTGNAAANILTGSAGKNTLKGLAGNDTLKGLEGNDVLDGGAGVDRLEGGLGNDTYVVDNAKDVIVELAGAGTDTVKASASHTLSANVERLTLTGSGNINGTGNADANILTGNAGKNTLKGLAGNDTLDGGAGIDRLEGGAGNDVYVVDNAGDVIVELKGEGTDTVKSSVSHALAANVERLTLTGSGNIDGTGNEASNILTGNAGKNILKGGAGNDTLIGGTGADQLYGGAGKDTFVFKSATDSTVASSGRDTIFDFTSGSDRIDLRGVDANSTMMDDQAFSFIGGSAFHKKAGELRFEVKSGDTIVQGDINGDGAADFSFVLDTVVNLKAGDFLL